MAKAYAEPKLIYKLNADGRSYKVVGCETSASFSIANIKIPDIYSGLPVTEIGAGAFKSLKIESITIPGSVTTIGKAAFSGCVLLTMVKIPNGVTHICGDAFEYCKRLKIVLISASVIRIDGFIFNKCDSLKKIWVEEDNKIYKSIDGNLYFEDGKTLLQYAMGKIASRFVIPDGVEKIGDMAFYDGKHLKTVIMPDSLKDIGSSAFMGCKKLKSAEIPAGVVNIGDSAFMSSGISSVRIPDGVTKIAKSTFAHTKLKNVTVPERVVAIGDSAFEGCPLTSVVIPESVGAIGREAFFECVKLRSVALSRNIVSIGERAFGRCDKLSIYSESEARRGGWSKGWNIDNNPVVWGYTLREVSKAEFVADASDYTIEPEIRSRLNAASALLMAKKWRRAMEIYEKISVDRPELPAGYIGRLLARLKLVDESELIKQTKPFDKLGEYKDITNLGDRGVADRIIAYNEEVKHTVAVNKQGFRFRDDGGVYAVSGMKFLARFKRQIDIPSHYMGKTVNRIDDGAFLWYFLLGRVGIPDTVNLIGKSAFSGCVMLRKAEIPVSVKSIGKQAFSSCFSLRRVLLPKNVTNLSACVFDHSLFLSVYCEAKKCPEDWASDWDAGVRNVVWGRLTDDSMETSKDNSIYLLNEDERRMIEEAELLLKSGKWKKAKIAYRAIIDAHPDISEGYIGSLLAKFHLYDEFELSCRLRRYEKSAEYIELMAKLDVDTYNKFKEYERQAQDIRRIIRERIKEESSRIATIVLNCITTALRAIGRVLFTILKYTWVGLLFFVGFVKELIISVYVWLRDDGLPSLGRTIVSGFKWLWHEGFPAFGRALLIGIKWLFLEALPTVGVFLLGLLEFIWDIIVSVLEWLWEDVILNVWEFLSDVFGGLFEFIGDAFGTVGRIILWILKIGGIILLIYLGIAILGLIFSFF